MLTRPANKHRSSDSEMARKNVASIETPHGPHKCFAAHVERTGRKPLLGTATCCPLSPISVWDGYADGTWTKDQRSTVRIENQIIQRREAGLLRRDQLAALTEARRNAPQRIRPGIVPGLGRRMATVLPTHPGPLQGGGTLPMSTGQMAMQDEGSDYGCAHSSTGGNSPRPPKQ